MPNQTSASGSRQSVATERQKRDDRLRQAIEQGPRADQEPERDREQHRGQEAADDPLHRDARWSRSGLPSGKPSTASSTALERSRLGGGNWIGRSQPASTATSQVAKNSPKATSGTSTGASERERGAATVSAPAATARSPRAAHQGQRRAGARPRLVDPPLEDDAARARRQDDDAVGEHQRLPDAVGDEDDRLAARRPDAQQLVLHLDARQLVERAERLVHQQDLRIERERAGDGDALLHAAGQLGRILGAGARETDERSRSSRAPERRPCRRRGSSPRTSRSGRGEPGKQRALLEHHALPAAGPVTGCPATRTSPLVACSSPATMLSSVVLPQPLRPSSTTNSFSRIVRSTDPSTGGEPGRSAANRFPTPSISIETAATPALIPGTPTRARFLAGSGTAEFRPRSSAFRLRWGRTYTLAPHAQDHRRGGLVQPADGTEVALQPVASSRFHDHPASARPQPFEPSIRLQS